MTSCYKNVRIISNRTRVHSLRATDLTSSHEKDELHKWNHLLPTTVESSCRTGQCQMSPTLKSSTTRGLTGRKSCLSETIFGVCFTAVEKQVKLVASWSSVSTLQSQSSCLYSAFLLAMGLRFVYGTTSMTGRSASKAPTQYPTTSASCSRRKTAARWLLSGSKAFTVTGGSVRMP